MTTTTTPNYEFDEYVLEGANANISLSSNKTASSMMVLINETILFDPNATRNGSRIFNVSTLREGVESQSVFGWPGLSEFVRTRRFLEQSATSCKRRCESDELCNCVEVTRFRFDSDTVAPSSV